MWFSTHRKGTKLSQLESKRDSSEVRSGPAKWVIVVAVLLMLAGILAYVLSLDEAIQPIPEGASGGKSGLPVPIAPPVPQTPPVSPVPPISPGAGGSN